MLIKFSVDGEMRRNGSAHCYDANKKNMCITEGKKANLKEKNTEE